MALPRSGAPDIYFDTASMQDERAAKGRKVVRLDKCHCCTKTYTPLVNAEHEEELNGESESQSKRPTLIAKYWCSI